MAGRPILVPLDGSELAEGAIPYAEALATATTAPLQLLMIVEEPSDGRRLDENNATLAELMALIRNGMLRYLECVAEELRQRGLTVETTVDVGRPAEAILAASRRYDAQLIVMATHGCGGIERWAVGSVADNVMRLSDRPVLLLRPSGSTLLTHPCPITLRRIAVPLDGSALAEQAIAPVVALAAATGATLLLVRAVPWLTLLAPGFDYVPDLGASDAAVEAAATEYLAGIRGGIAAPATARCVVLRGRPGEVLPEYAQANDVDLVVMTTHGRGGLRRVVLGSVADRMVRACVPTLLVRPNIAAEQRTEDAPKATLEAAARG